MTIHQPKPRQKNRISTYMTYSDQVSLAPNCETYVGDGKSSHEESHLDHAGASSRWAQMTMYLAGRSEAPKNVSNSYWTSLLQQGASVSRHRGKAHALVSLVEYKSVGTVVLSWRDATGASYGNQTWHRVHSLRSGVCALSGRAIRSGDLVFRPATRGAANAWAMILDGSVKALCTRAVHDDAIADD
ncbi:DUF3331 domain-containing protein [Cupriavidus sp. IDO]|uniref:DUF3331 domain-containing protein n=1 Tax=Cupriavidus sp. IDO TaxID=1539142 RepID=UPI0009E56E02